MIAAPMLLLIICLILWWINDGRWPDER